MPYSPESHLISSIVLNGDLPTAVARGISSDMFHVHAEEWAWLMDYVSKYKKTPTRVAFMAAFKTWRLARVNDTAHFADEVRTEHVKHLLLGGMNELADFIADGDVDTALKKLHALTVGAAAGVGIAHDSDIFQDFDDVWADAESRFHRQQSNGAAGIPSGINSIDEATGGFNNGELIVIAARLGEGKSWAMQHCGVTAALAGHGVQYNSMEMSRSQVAYRLYSLLSGTIGSTLYKNTELMQGRVPDMRQFRKFVEELKVKMTGRLHISDASRGQVSSLTVATQIERNKPNIVFLDYLGLMKRDADWQGMGKLTGELKQIAVQYDIPIVAASQLNRENGLGKEPPGAEALALADAIGQDADMVITMKLMSRSVLKMRLAKTRHAVGDEMWYMRFQPGNGVIKEISSNRADDLMAKDREDAIARSERKRA